MPQDPTGHLLHKATQPRQGHVADLRKTQKQVQKGSPNEETNMSQMKEWKTPEKEPNELEASNIPDREFKTLVMRMLKELSGNFNKETISIKRGHISQK